MKIKTNIKVCNELKNQLKQKIEKVAQDTTNWTSEQIRDAKQTYKTKVEPKFDEFITYTKMALDPPKIEILSKKMTQAQKNYLFADASYNVFVRKFPENKKEIQKMHENLMELKAKAQNATDSYNRFAALQDAAQKAFESLNK